MCCSTRSFKIGGLAVTPIFLLKASIFLFLLVSISHFVQRLVLSRVFRHLSISDSQKFALGRFTTYALFLGGLFIGLQSLGVNLNSLVVFGGAIGVGVGLGLQNVVANFVAGIILLVEQPLRIGDRIETADTLGDVVKIAARATWIRTNDNVVIIVPNSTFINNSVTNWTANDPQVRIGLTVGVGYNSNPEQVRAILLEAAKAHPQVLSKPEPDVIFTDYGDNSINFTLRVWTQERSHTPMVLKSDLYFDLFKRFEEAGIELPFPQRDLHLRSSDVPLVFGGGWEAKASEVKNDRGTESQAAGYGGELVAGDDLFRGETRFKDPPNGGDEARAAGEEDAVDLLGRGLSGFEKIVDGGFDGLEVGGDPLLEVVASDFSVRAGESSGKRKVADSAWERSILRCWTAWWSW